jgi:catechol 2,3-dioxygenase-like lactoylglutathione lyase family enzyme
MTDDQRPELDQLNFVVADMEAMVAFYRRLGVEIPNNGPPWDRHHRSANVRAGLDLDLDSETFGQVWNRGQPDTGARIVVGFRFADRESVDRTYADLVAAGYPSQQEPYDAFWGARYAVVEDPDGNSVGLMSPADDAYRGPSPPPPS